MYRREGKGSRGFLRDRIQFLAALAILHNDDLKNRLIRDMYQDELKNTVQIAYSSSHTGEK